MIDRAAHAQNCRERAECRKRDEDAAEYNPREQSVCKKARISSTRRVLHNVLRRRFHSQCNGRQTVSHQIDKKDLCRQQNDRQPHQNAEKHSQHLTDVACKQIPDEFPDIGIDGAPLPDG